eukprot:5454287-Pleurochrysis_carterae.AAC.1
MKKCACGPESKQVEAGSAAGRSWDWLYSEQKVPRRSRPRNSVRCRKSKTRSCGANGGRFGSAGSECVRPNGAQLCANPPPPRLSRLTLLTNARRLRLTDHHRWCATTSVCQRVQARASGCNHERKRAHASDCVAASEWQRRHQIIRVLAFAHCAFALSARFVFFAPLF